MPPKDYRKECQGSSCRLQLTVVFDRVQFKSRMRRLHSVLVPRHFNLDFIKRHRWNRSGLLSWNRSSTHSCFSHCIPHLKLSSLWSDCVQKKLQQRKKKAKHKKRSARPRSTYVDPHMWILVDSRAEPKTTAGEEYRQSFLQMQIRRQKVE